MQDINLCETLVQEMHKLEFSERSIALTKSSTQFKQATNEPATIQRAMLTLLLSHTLMMGPFVVPAEVRLSLNMATDNIGWSDDLKLVILPFLKVNEEHFYH